MRYFDIETGKYPDDSWGYIIHDNGHGPADGFKYGGVWDSARGFGSEDEAVESARESLNDVFGERGWVW